MEPRCEAGRRGRKWGMSVNNDLSGEPSAIARHFLISITDFSSLCMSGARLGTRGKWKYKCVLQMIVFVEAKRIYQAIPIVFLRLPCATTCNVI